jgi:hypothetical protein
VTIRHEQNKSAQDVSLKKSQEKLSTFEDFENRRRFPRLNMNLAVTVSGPGGGKFKGVIHDMSPDGVQIRYEISEGMKIYPDKESSAKELHAMGSTLQFDLAYSKTVAHVRIDAHPAYLRSMDNATLACGMFFREDKLAENKKISDFLFHQLQLSYADIDQKKHEPQEQGLGTGIRQTIIQTQKQADGPAPELLISDELEQLILQVDYPKAQLEPLKDIMYRVLTSLKVIQEITRHIDERINLIEHKISRRN